MVTLDFEDKFRQVREIPLLISEYCSHFDFQNFEFQAADQLLPLHQQLATAFPTAFIYQIKATSFHNSHGYLFNESDYKRLGHHLLFVLGMFAINKNKPVRSSAQRGEGVC